jgi:hypothetical protein
MLKLVLSKDLFYEESIQVGPEATSVKELPSSIRDSISRQLTPIGKDLNLIQIMLNY